MLLSAGLYCSLVAPREMRRGGRGGRSSCRVITVAPMAVFYFVGFFFFFWENKQSDNVILAGIQLGESQAVWINLLWLLHLQTEMGCCAAAL